MMTRNQIFFLLFCFLPIFLFAQKEQVTFKVRNAAPFRKFECSQISQFDFVNGKFSAGLASSNQYIFEISEVTSKNMKCKSVLKQAKFKATLIDTKLERTYTSTEKSKGTLKIDCLPDGRYQFIYCGDVYDGKQKVSINATLVGEVAHSKN